MRQAALMIMLFWVGSWGVQAATVPALYEAQVGVSSQSEAERAVAVKEALRQVLLKVVGNRSALSRISLDPLLKEAPNLVQQFRYQTVEEEEGEAVTLWVRFDPAGVERALRQQALPVWSKGRPTLLLWVVFKEERKRYLLDDNTESPGAEILKEQAQVRGMPVIFPLWDLTDRTELAFTDIWGNFSDSIRTASRRYPASVQLVGRLRYRQASDWQARWTLYGMSEEHNWTVSGALEPVLRAGVDEAVDIIAAHVAPITARDSRFSVQVKVTDVTSYRDYARLASYLNSLSQVVDIQPVQLTRTKTHFKLELQGDPQGLVDSILLGRVLTPASAGADAESGTLKTELNYRLLP